MAALSEALDRKHTTVKSHKRKGRKSKPLPEHLPVVEVEHASAHTEHQDCAKTMKRIDKETVDQLGVVPQVTTSLLHSPHQTEDGMSRQVWRENRADAGAATTGHSGKSGAIGPSNRGEAFVRPSASTKYKIQRLLDDDLTS